MRQAFKILKNQTGSALLMALFTITLLMVLATEIQYQTTVETKVSANAVQQLKAYYAAKAGVELGLFRVYLYRKAVAQFGDAIPDKSLLDLIWNFPFSWPPPVPEDLNLVDKDSIQTAVKSSLMQSQYSIAIESESSKIDINDLASPSKAIAKATREQLLKIFESRLQSDESFSKVYRNFDFNRLINNIADWVDEDQQSLNGGDEKALYSEINNEYIPPNQPFKTVSELHMVAEMTDDFFDILAPQITVFGAKGINVNYATQDILQAVHPGITPEFADKIIERRSNPALGGPFKEPKEFFEFLQTLGVQIENDQASQDPNDPNASGPVPVITDPEFNFRIKATGHSGQAMKDIVAVTYDFDQVKDRLSGFIQQQADADKGAADAGAAGTGASGPSGKKGATVGGGAATKSGQKKKIKVPKERPTVVYWAEG